MENNKIFAERMRESRLKADLSQAELSRRTKIAAATLSTYESTDNPKNPTIDKAIAIAQELNVSLDWMCGLDNQKNYTDKTAVKEIFDAIFTLSKMHSSTIEAKIRGNEECEDALVITLFGDGFYNCAKELMKVKYLIDSPDSPNYLKLALKSAIYNKFADLL